MTVPAETVLWGEMVMTRSFSFHLAFVLCVTTFVLGALVAGSWFAPGFSTPEAAEAAEATAATKPVAIVSSRLAGNLYGAQAYQGLVDNAIKALAEAGITAAVLTDDDLAAGRLMGYAVAILPTNPVMGPEHVEPIKAFLRAGGALLTSYETSVRRLDRQPGQGMQLAELFQVDLQGWDQGAKKYAYIHVTDAAHPVFQGLQPYIPMRRNMTFVVEPLPDGRTIGTWVDADKLTPSQEPPQDAAVIVTDRTVYFAENIFDMGDPTNRIYLKKLVVNSVLYLLQAAKVTQAASPDAAAAEERPSKQSVRSAAVQAKRAKRQFDLAAQSLLDVPYDRLKEVVANAEQEARMAEEAYNTGEDEQVEIHTERAKVAAERAERLAMESRSVEARGAWIDNGELARMYGREDVAGLLDRLAAINVNILFPETVYRGWTLHWGSVGPRDYRFSHWDEDPLQVLIEEAHKRGMEVHPWVWVFCVGYSHDQGPVLSAHPDWAEVTKDGSLFPNSKYGTAWLNPTLPAVREYLVAEFAELVTKYDVDGLHFDYIRYSEEQVGSFGYSPASLDAFQQATGLDARQIRPRTKEAEIWNEWRRQNVTSFVRDASAYLKKLKPGVKISAAVVPDIEGARQHTLQDWKTWLDNRYVDFLNNMAYTDNLGRLETLTGQITQAAEGRSMMYPGLGVWINQPRQLANQIQAVQEAGLGGVVLFATVHMTDEHFLWLQEGPFRVPALLPHKEPVRAATLLLQELQRRLATYQQLGAVDEATAKALIGDIGKIAGSVQASGDQATDELMALQERIAEQATNLDEPADKQAALERVAQELAYATYILRAAAFLR